MNLQRIFNMGPAEWLFRGRQEACKALGLLSAAVAVPSRKPRRCTFDRRACAPQLLAAIARQENYGDHVSAALLKQGLSDHMGERFFSPVNRQLLQACARVDDRYAEQVVADADAVCRGEFDILGYGKMSFGNPVNWQLDPLSGRESASIHWSRIDPLAVDRVGDSKVVWELNRHQWLLDLGQAYQLSGDERYAQCFVALLSQWMERNPVGVGINWSSALEAAMRLITWCWALRLFRDSPSLTTDFFLTMLAWIQSHAQFVMRNLSRYFSPNTHLTVEALALFYAGTLLPELRGAARWQKLGSQILCEEIEKQVLADGVYFEQSTRYQYYTVEIYLHFLILSQRNKLPVAPAIRQGLVKMLEFLLHLRRPDGSLPQIGDADGGWLLPIVRRGPGDYQSVFSTAAAVFGDRRFAWAAGKLAVETLCLLGLTAEKKWQALRPKPPLPAPLHHFPHGGYVVMRSGWQRDDHQLIFDTGPRQAQTSSGHDHADLLSIQCSAYGENYLVDPGTYCYTADCRWRDYFRSSLAHSAVVIDDRGQAEPDGPFSWCERPQSRGHRLASAVDTYSAESDYQSQGLSHCRRVLFVGGEYWLVVDELTGTGRHSAEICFQFAPLPMQFVDDGWLCASGEHSRLFVKAFSSCSLTGNVFTGELTPARGWLSPNYGQRVAAPSLSFSARSSLPMRIVTVLWPQRDTASRPPVITAVIEDATLLGLRIDAPIQRLIRF